MGLFSSKNKIFVASSVYNLGGDEDQIPSFLKTVIANHTISRSPSTLGKALSSSYLSGPGTKLRSFYSWSRRRYMTYSFGGTKVLGFKTVTAQNLVPLLPFTNTSRDLIKAIKCNTGDFGWWAERWLLDHYPELHSGIWEPVMPNGPSGGIYINVPGRDRILVPKDGYHPGKIYLYVLYQESDTGKLRVYIYEYQTGILEIDRLMLATQEINDYLPVLPIRLNNQFVSESYKPHLYSYGKKALKRAIGANFDELVSRLEENEQLGDIDYAFVAPGVCLNTKVKAGKEYIYRFLSELKSSSIDIDQYATWKAKQQLAEEDISVYDGWVAAGSVGTAPKGQGMPAAPTNIIKTALEAIDYSTTLEWRTITETVGSGLAKPDAKVGDLWWDEKESFNWKWVFEDFQNERVTIADKDTHVSLTWQVGSNSWKKLDIVGLVHKNYVYKDKFVEINAAEALADEELSGLFLPLKSSILRSLSVKDSTELSSSSMLLVLNSYVIKKIKWYQRGFFKLLLVVAIIATVAFTGGFSATGIGVLGTNLAVGTAIGLAGLAAVVAGVVINAIAAIIITTIITKGATAIFGDQIGQIVGLVASFVAVSGLSNFATTGNFAVNFGQLAKVDKLIQMTSAVGSAAAKSIQAEANSIIQETQDLMKNYEGQMEKISKAFAEQIGYGNGIIDPTQFVTSNQPASESPDEFLARTLMTGSDIAELSLSMVSNFTDISLDLNRLA